jgi:hypothetical protein
MGVSASAANHMLSNRASRTGSLRYRSRRSPTQKSNSRKSRFRSRWSGICKCPNAASWKTFGSQEHGARSTVQSEACRNRGEADRKGDETDGLKASGQLAIPPRRAGSPFVVDTTMAGLPCGWHLIRQVRLRPRSQLLRQKGPTQTCVIPSTPARNPMTAARARHSPVRSCQVPGKRSPCPKIAVQLASAQDTAAATGPTFRATCRTRSRRSSESRRPTHRSSRLR